jgi:hypothetical protein
MCFFGLKVEARLLAFFAVVLEKFEELDNIVIIRVSG